MSEPNRSNVAQCAPTMMKKRQTDSATGSNGPEGNFFMAARRYCHSGIERFRRGQHGRLRVAGGAAAVEPAGDAVAPRLPDTHDREETDGVVRGETLRLIDDLPREARARPRAKSVEEFEQVGRLENVEEIGRAHV